jgi:HNH endonuclease
MEARQCEYCSDTIERPPYKLSKTSWERRRFCSDACRLKAHKPTPRTGAVMPLEERFWNKVQVCEHGKTCRDCCWLWIGAINKDGYGIMFKTKAPKVEWYRSNRLAYELFVGPIPEGLHALHNCPGGDNPACVNYNGHLWLGTQAENNADKEVKGRGGKRGGHLADRRGMSNGHARLPDETIAAIQALYATGVWSQNRLAVFFGCGQSHISRIIRGEQRQPLTTAWIKPARQEG